MICEYKTILLPTLDGSDWKSLGLKTSKNSGAINTVGGMTTTRLQPRTLQFKSLKLGRRAFVFKLKGAGFGPYLSEIPWDWKFMTDVLLRLGWGLVVVILPSFTVFKTQELIILPWPGNIKNLSHIACLVAMQQQRNGNAFC